VRWPALLLAPVRARAAMVMTVAAVPYARTDGLGTGYYEGARGPALAVALAWATVAAVLTLGAGGLALLAVAALVALVVAGWARSAIGGGTGDVYGAVCELAETAVLVVVLGMDARGLLAPWPVAG
jgi:adenosylcobinamide-GDP ribazoletransferase